LLHLQGFCSARCRQISGGRIYHGAYVTVWKSVMMGIIRSLVPIRLAGCLVLCYRNGAATLTMTRYFAPEVTINALNPRSRKAAGASSADFLGSYCRRDHQSAFNACVRPRKLLVRLLFMVLVVMRLVLCRQRKFFISGKRTCHWVRER
jgi:hypothetical protein